MCNTCSLLHVLEGSLSSSLTLKIPIQEFFHSVQTSNQLTYFFFFFFFLLSFIFLMSILSSLFSLDSLFYQLWWLPHKYHKPLLPLLYLLDFCTYLTSEIPSPVKLNSWPLFPTCTRTVDWPETVHDHKTLKWDLRNMLHFLNQWNLQFSETAVWPFLFSSQTDYLTPCFT